MKFLYILPVLLLLGCSHTVLLTGESSPQEYARINRIGRNKRAKLELVSGRLFLGESVGVSADSVHLGYIEPDIVQTMRESGFRMPPRRTADFSTDEVKWIRVRNPTLGGLQGFAAGILVGLAASAIIEEPVWKHGLHGSDAVWISVMTPIIIGSVAGTIIGSPVTIRFEP